MNGSGQLGVVVSSARYKHDIESMGDRSSKLLNLRPVTFRYNNDPAGTLQYGLVAEEVAKVYPELVVYGDDGKVESVRYSMLSALLLNELQKEIAENQRQAAELKASNQREMAMRTAFEQRLSRLEQTIIAERKDARVQAAFNYSR